ncbi:MAG: hypothetical protein QW184_00400 [Nanopusillaceae archaeon]
MGIFKLYDIRGKYGTEITDEITFKIGLAIGKYFSEDNYIGIIRDVRIHSERIKNILVSALTHTHNVIDFGRGSTPEANYLARVYSIPFLVVTASHNPKEYNGIKIINNKGFELFPEEIKKIEEIFRDIKVPSERVGIVEEDNSAIEIYKWYLYRKFKDIKGYRIGYDPSNSVMSLFKDVLLDLGNELYPINDKLDGNFPSHPPDPSVDENMKQMIELVKNKKLDFGVVFDGDGDRVGFVDKNGRIVKPYEYILAFIKEKRKFLLEISLPIFLRDHIKNKNADFIISRTGRPFIIKKSMENNVFLAVESSCHYYFYENFYSSDSLYAILRLLRELNKNNLSLEDLKSPKFYYEHISVDKTQDIINILKEYFRNREIKIENLSGELDGLEFIGDHFRILVRESQTESLYRVVLESYNDVDIFEIRNLILKNL